MKRIRDYKHVIWDWNGTLLDDSWLCVDIMNAMLGRRGLPLLSFERYQQIFDFPVIVYYRRLGFDLAREPFEVLSVEFISEYERRRSELSLQPETARVLSALREAGLSQSVLSAYKHSTLEHILREFGLRDYFLHVIGSDDHYASGKVEQGRRHVQLLHVPPAQVVLVGDTLHDHEVAQAMGIDCLLIPCGYHSRERLRGCGVPIVERLADLVG